MSLNTRQQTRVDVIGLAQQLAHYIQITAEDGEFLNKDPTRRDRVLNELYKDPRVKPNVYPETFDTPTDEHLRLADEMIAKLTPPQSFEDRVRRLLYATPASVAFYMAKIAILPEELKIRIEAQKETLMTEWYARMWPTLFPDHRPASTTLSTPLNCVQVPHTPPGAVSTVPKRVSTDEVAEFMNSPQSLVGRQFVYSPPAGGTEGTHGGFEVLSYAVCKRDGVVEHEYQVPFEEFGWTPVPMDQLDVQHLLTYSTFAG